MAFEDLTAALLKWQAPRLDSRSIVAAAVTLHSVETRHAAWIRHLIGLKPATSAFDKPASQAADGSADRLDALRRVAAADGTKRTAAVHRLNHRSMRVRGRRARPRCGRRRGRDWRLGGAAGGRPPSTGSATAARRRRGLAARSRAACLHRRRVRSCSTGARRGRDSPRCLRRVTARARPSAGCRARRDAGTPHGGGHDEYRPRPRGGRGVTVPHGCTCDCPCCRTDAPAGCLAARSAATNSSARGSSWTARA